MFEQEIKQQWMISNDALITFDTILDCVLKLFFFYSFGSQYLNMVYYKANGVNVVAYKRYDTDTGTTFSPSAAGKL